MTEIMKAPSMQARDAQLNWLDGYMRGVTSMNGMIKGHQRVSGTAFLMRDVGGDINLALSNHHGEICASLTKDFPDMDVAEFKFEPAEARSEWLRWLHVELDQSLLPSPVALHRVRDRALVDTRYNVAWNVMEITCHIAGHFGPPQIHSAKFSRRDEYIGCAYVIPLKDCHLVLRFQTTIEHASPAATVS
jgi:hypothetical protein